MNPAKAALRTQIREEAQKHSAEERRAGSVRLCDLLRAQAIWKSARAVLLFMPTLDEPNILPVVTEAIQQGKLVALPAFAAELAIYQALQIRDMHTDLAQGRFGIPEPCAGCAPVLVNTLDLILIPGVAFSVTGVRLGRGKGFYDRLLAQTTPNKCGVAFNWQIVDEIPREAHDITVDFLVTPTQFLSTTPTP
jgi:5-formyltetrahydrofolate cyclo-ligase